MNVYVAGHARNTLCKFVMKGRTANVTIRIAPDAKADLQRIADAERRTLSQLIAIVLDDYLKQRREK